MASDKPTTISTVDELADRLDNFAPMRPLRFEDQHGTLLGDTVTDIYVYFEDLIIALDVSEPES